MRLKVQEVEAGLDRREVIVSVQTREGIQYLSVSKRSLGASDSIEVGNPVGRSGEFYLVELPDETDSGLWRVWVNKDQVLTHALEAAE